MSESGKLRKARHHLVLPVEVWEALVLEARQRRKRISHVVQEHLVASLGILRDQRPPGGPADVPMAEVGERHHCRLTLDPPIWIQLMHEAAIMKVSVTERIRQRLRQAVLGETVGMASRGHEEPTPYVNESPPPKSGGEPRSITMLEL